MRAFAVNSFPFWIYKSISNIYRRHPPCWFVGSFQKLAYCVGCGDDWNLRFLGKVNDEVNQLSVFEIYLRDFVADNEYRVFRLLNHRNDDFRLCYDRGFFWT